METFTLKFKRTDHNADPMMVYVHAFGVSDDDFLFSWEKVKAIFMQYGILTMGQLGQIEKELINGSISSATTNAAKDTVLIAISNTLVRNRGDEQ